MADAPLSVPTDADFSGWRRNSTGSNDDVELEELGRVPAGEASYSGPLWGRRVERLSPELNDPCLTGVMFTLCILISVLGVYVLINGIDKANLSVTENNLHLRKVLVQSGLSSTVFGTFLATCGAGFIIRSLIKCCNPIE